MVNKIEKWAKKNYILFRILMIFTILLVVANWETWTTQTIPTTTGSLFGSGTGIAINGILIALGIVVLVMFAPTYGAVALGLAVLLATLGGFGVAISSVIFVFENSGLLFWAGGLIFIYLITRNKKSSSHINYNDAFKQITKK